jgi:hypothetical protein
MKLTRDLLELRNATLQEIKAHLLGRDVTGAVRQPQDVYHGNPEVMFERDFRKFLQPWRQLDLRLKCKDCGRVDETIETRSLDVVTDPSGIPALFPQLRHTTEWVDLCPKCYRKRMAESPAKEELEPNIDLAPEHVPRPLSAFVDELRGDAEMQVKELQPLSPSERVVKLEELLAKQAKNLAILPPPPGLEAATEAYRSTLQAELNRTRQELEGA